MDEALQKLFVEVPRGAFFEPIIVCKYEVGHSRITKVP
jgi:hypothetical protein